MNIIEARTLMEEWTQSPALRIHMEAVAICMEAYARKLEPDELDRWIVAGLLHDYDYAGDPISRTIQSGTVNGVAVVGSPAQP